MFLQLPLCFFFSFIPTAIRTDSCHLPHPARCSCPQGGSHSHESAAESWWSEVTILGHGLNWSNKNRLHSNHLLWSRAGESGSIVCSPATLLNTVGCLCPVLYVLIIYCVFYWELCKGALCPALIKSQRYFSKETKLFMYWLLVFLLFFVPVWSLCVILVTGKANQCLIWQELPVSHKPKH